MTHSWDEVFKYFYLMCHDVSSYEL